MDVSILITGIGTVAAIVGVMYSFLRNFKSDLNTNLEKRLDSIDHSINSVRFDHQEFSKRIDKRFDKIDERFDRMDNEIKELRACTYRLEGAFYNQECCVVKEKKPRKKAQ